jgi:hypothetical protein
VPVLLAIRAEVQSIPGGAEYQPGGEFLLKAIDSYICFKKAYAPDGSIGQKAYEQCEKQ